MANEIDNPGALSRRLIVAVVTPLALVVTVGVILGFQIFRLVDTARWVEHTDEVVSKLYELDTRIAEQEATFRGFILTEDAATFPRPDDAPLELVTQLKRLVGDNPPQVAALEDISKRYAGWRVNTDAARHDTARAKTPDVIRARAVRMTEMRLAIAQATSLEMGLRRERVAASDASVRATEIALVLLVAGAGVVLAFLSRKTLRDITSTYGDALEREQTGRAELEEQQWIRARLLDVSSTVQGEHTVAELATRTLAELVRATEADVGAFYAVDGNTLVRQSGHAVDPEGEGARATIARGEGLVGQTAVDMRLRDIDLDALPAGYFDVGSGTGSHPPSSLIIAPAIADGVAAAVIELGFLKTRSDRAVDLVRQAGDIIAVAARTAVYRERLQELLVETQRQAEELQSQQEELRVTNEELAEQASALRVAQAELERQQTELEETNAGLEQQAERLEEQKVELVIAGERLVEKATELERTNRFKSEFLANMSHELRTPLNSALILAKLLADNRDGNLTPEQIKFAETIYGAGNDLLTLINDILDLAKIEAGKMELRRTKVALPALVESLGRTFTPIAKKGEIGLRFELAPDVPRTFLTDAQRLEQILRNLLSNAVKFTHKGEVTLQIRRVGDDIAFAVSDTGIGIARAQQALVFDAFKQEDGATTRRYGGTGLGLSISRDLARLLGGEIKLESEKGSGSTFTLLLPIAGAPLQAAPAPREPDPPPRFDPIPEQGGEPRPPPFPDDRAMLAGARRVLLAVEDDPRFAKIVYDLAHELDFKCVVAQTADEAIELAQKLPIHAVVLDLNLPDHPGLAVLDRLKRSSATRHLPVHIISVQDETRAALQLGAIGLLLKPATREDVAAVMRRLEATLSRSVRRVLVVEDDETQRDSVKRLLTGNGVEAVGAASVAEALDLLATTTFDCIVTDLGLPEVSGDDLLETMAADERYAFPPVIVYTGRALTEDEEQRLRRLSDAIIVKGARSPERLLDEVSLFLHQVESKMPPERQRMLRDARDREAVFEGRRILVAEDDVRNVFALTSVLESRGAVLDVARNGREALEHIEKQRPDLVLMDVMMPEMDGLEATRRIRRMPTCADLPIIALTAKAMRDDRDRCLAAGASDYLAKPIDIDKLVSLVRVWMPR